MDYVNNALELAQDYGWFILISFVLIYYVYKKYILTSPRHSEPSIKKNGI